MRILVTGASGFLGRHVLNALADTNDELEVHALARHVPGPGESIAGGANLGRGTARAVWHQADLLIVGEAERQIAAIRPDRLIHLAWYATPGKFWGAAENGSWIDASLRLLRAFGEAGGKRAVMAGTCAEYAWGVHSLREDVTQTDPSTFYGACKHAAHVAATVLAREVGVSMAWARLFFLYGPGEPRGRLIADLATGLLAGERVPVTSGKQVRDFIHVMDAAGALAAILQADLAGPVNVGSGIGVPISKIARMVGNLLEADELLAIGALPDRPGDPASVVADADLLTGGVGFRPHVDLLAGLTETVAWWQARVKKPALP